jgi:dihydrofolate reductase
MARFVFEMNMSLDGYVDHDRFAPGVDLFRHFTDRVAGLSGSLYGRRIYDLMRYWEEDQPDWTDDHRAFAEVWRAMPKWVVSRSDPPLGPNATLLAGDLDDALRDLKASVEGEIAVAGPVLAGHLTTLGLIDEYRWTRPSTRTRPRPASMPTGKRRTPSRPARTRNRAPRRSPS